RADELVVVKFLDHLLAHAFDIEGIARHEVPEALNPLRRTDEPAGAASYGIDLAGLLVDIAHRVASAYRTGLREMIGFGTVWPLFGDEAQDLRNDIARSLHDDGVADADVFALNLILVVERRILNDDAADGYRLEAGNRRQGAGAADLDVDVFEDGHRLFGGEFVGNRPARIAR